ncbi:MAG: hypothetical protein CMA11_03835 [Euryarchaeota archaeon]|nr:hypothetical protein [Euryarchaeota archaeon]
MNRQIVSDKLQGFVGKPFTFYFPIQRGFSGSIQSLPFRSKFPILLAFTLVLHHQAAITAHPVFDSHESNHLLWDLTGNISGFTFGTNFTHSHKQSIAF